MTSQSKNSTQRRILKCLVWLSAADEPTNKNYHVYVEKIRLEFDAICANRFTILSSKDFKYGGQEEYESRICAVEVELEIDADDVSAAEKLLCQTFCRHQVCAPTPSLFLEILHPKTEDNYSRGTYYDSIPIRDFGIGHLSYDGSFQCNFRYGAEYSPTENNHPRLTLELDTEKLCIDFIVANDGVKKGMINGVAECTEVHRLEIAFRDLSYYILVDERSDQWLDLYFLNTTVPLQLWRTKDCHTSFNFIDSSRTRWIRTCKLQSSRTDLHPRLTRQVLGNSSTFCISLMRKTNVLPRHPDPRDIISSLVDVSGFAVECVRMNVKMVKVDPHAKAPYLGYGEETDLIDWNIAVLFHIGFRMHDQIRFVQANGGEPTLFEGLVRSYADGDSERKHILEGALSHTFDVISSTGLDPHFHLVDRVLEYFLRQGAKKTFEDKIPPSCRMVKRIMITPSRVVVLPPAMQHDNRILREFDHRCAVSVSFQNEDASRFDNSSTRDYVYEAIAPPLLQGIRIASKVYDYLACSSSQLRDQGCWLYAQDAAGRDAHYIRSWMGDLTDIKHAGRKLSRMGQCFSDSVEVDINLSGLIAKGAYKPDIVRNGYTFSDGIGKISPELLKQVCTDRRVGNSNDELPSALQIRFGGCKGMLAVDPRLTGNRMELRMSMLKFMSNHKKLEVNKISAPTPLVMNRQVITLLSQVKKTGGIPDKVFIQLLCRMMHRFADSLLDDRVAVTKLGDSGFSCQYARLYEAGFRFTTDVFFRRLLTVVTRARIEGVRAKARIDIPIEYGRTMLGVLDEFDCLEYGQVFVKYSADVKDPGKQTIVHEGTVVVGKMPGLYPGDIRKLEAVDVDETLGHLVDVIVFPAKGPRPHPNEISGSDLDGDEYWVSWYPDIIFQGDNEPAADFKSAKKESQEHSVTVKDLVNFMVDFATNDKVGVIANAHLAWADRLDIHSDECLNLARIHSHIVDFVKTGYLPNELNHLVELLPEAYPDFMDKADHKDTYRSEKVLGQIYRIACKLNVALSSVQTDKSKAFEMENGIDDRFFIMETYKEYENSAERLYETYTASINRIMRRYGIETEEELIGCTIVAKSTTRNVYTRTEDRHDLDKLLQVKIEEIKKNTRAEFHRELNEMFGGEPPLNAKLAKAAACYYVAYYVKGGTDFQGKTARRSFPWLFPDYMVEILHRNDVRDVRIHNICLDNLSTSILAKDASRVEENFLRARLSKSGYKITESLARVVSELIEWAESWEFIAEKSAVKMKCSVFGSLIESIIRTDSRVVDLIDGDCGLLLLAFLRAITDLDDIVTEKAIVPKTLQDLKISALIAHYQLARHPDVCALAARQQSQEKRTITVHSHQWESIKHRIFDLREEYLQKFAVSVVFRQRRRGGSMLIRGPGLSVEEFYDYWIAQVSRREWENERTKRLNDELRLSNSDDSDGDDAGRAVIDRMAVNLSFVEICGSKAEDGQSVKECA